MAHETLLNSDQINRLLQCYSGEASPAGITTLIHSLLDKTTDPEQIADNYLSIQNWGGIERIGPARILAKQSIKRILPSHPRLKKIGIDPVIETMTDVNLFRSMVLISRSAWYVICKQHGLEGLHVFNDLQRAKALIDESTSPANQKTDAIMVLYTATEFLKKSQQIK